jgi:HAD superfamily hydrolase (TIGR01484 family)
MLLQENTKTAKMNLLFSNLRKRLDAKFELEQLPFVEVSSSLEKNLELNKKGGNKGNGLLALAEYLGIQRDQIMACGDSDNDYSMIKAAGLGIAMDNGLETIKKIADAVTLSNDLDGVAYAIEQWVLTE